MTRFYAAALAFMLLQASAHALESTERDLIEAELKQPISVLLKNRQTISGNPISVTEGQIELASAEGAGEIVFTFTSDEIRQIEIPGESYKSFAIELMNAGESQSARDLMSMLYEQRSPLLPIMPPEESNFFILYVELILESPNPAGAIGVSSRLRPQIKNTSALQALDDAILNSYHRLELHEEAFPLAENWVKERSPYGDSALGYYVLGSHHFREADFEAALDLALQPIVFASPLAKENLAHCYALAVSAAYENRERKYAALLFEEMQERGFLWPIEDSTLQSYEQKIIQYRRDHEAN